MKIKLVALLICCCSLAHANLSFEIPVKHLRKHHLKFLAYPGLLSVALENSGRRLSWSGHLKVPNKNMRSIELIRDKKFPFKKASLKYLNREKDVFWYEGALDWNVGMASKSINLKIAVDGSNLDKGKLHATVKSPWLKLLPAHFSKYVNERINGFADEKAEKQLVEYLNSINVKSLSPKEAGFTIFHDAYHRTVTGAGQPKARVGDAEPISDQIFVIISLFLWLVGVPTLLVTRYLKSRAPSPSKGSSRPEHRL